MPVRSWQIGTLLAIAGVAAIATFAEDKQGAQTPKKAPPAQGQANPRVAIEPRRTTPAETTDRRAPNLRIDANLVLIPVTVTTPLNQVVTGMEREQFRLFEDKSEQNVTHFSSEEQPVSLGMVFDVSSSMGSKLHKARQAAAQFFRTANPEDEFFLVTFNDRPEMVIPFTTNTEEIQNRLAFTQAKGRTALLDGVYLAMHEMKKAKNPRRAILLISDGADNSSRYTVSEIRNVVREADVIIYGIGIFEPVHSRGRSAEELSGPSMLGEIAEQTGGRHFPVENLNDLPDIAAKVGVELRSQYMLGYLPTNQNRDGKYRRVEVKLVQPRGLPPLRAYHRLGYYAPSQ